MRTAVLVFLGLAAIFVAGSFLFDPRVEVSRAIVIEAQPRDIHPWIDDLERWPRWSPFDRIEPPAVYVLGPLRAGVGASRSWTSDTRGSGRQTIVRSEPDAGVWMELMLEGVPEPGRVAITFHPVEGGTEVRWTDAFHFGDNPLYRWMTPFLDDIVGSAFEQGLADLKALVEAAPPSDA